MGTIDEKGRITPDNNIDESYTRTQEAPSNHTTFQPVTSSSPTSNNFKFIKILFFLILIVGFIVFIKIQFPKLTNENIVPPPPVTQNTIHYSNESPELTINSWIIALGNKNTNVAFSFNCSNAKSLGNYDYFSSKDKGYGGIVNTRIINVNLVSKNKNTAIVQATYEAYDPFNRNGKFYKNFYLKKNNTGWCIHEIKNYAKPTWYN